MSSGQKFPSSVNGYLSSFHLLHKVKKAPVNMAEQLHV